MFITHMKKKYNKIVIVMLKKHFMNTDVQVFDIDLIKRRGYEVEIWTLVNMTSIGTIKFPTNGYRGEEVRQIDAEDELIDAIRGKDTKETFFIIYPGRCPGRTERILKKTIVCSGGKYANYSYPSSHLPGEKIIDTNDNRPSVVKYYLNRWRKNKYNFYEDMSIFYFDFRYGSTFDFIQCTAQLKYSYNKFSRFNKKCIIVHTFDYDRIIRNRDKKKIPYDNKYAVFIDQYLVGHSDYKTLGLKPPISDKDRYYTELNHFFSIIEEKYGLDVVIAQHPKAEYEDNPFQSRKMIMGITDELIRYSEICIFHFSTSFSTILMYKKKFFQLLTTDLQMSGQEYEIIKDYEDSGLTKVTNVNEVSLDTIENYINIYDEDKYAQYIKMYIKPDESVEKLNMDTILDCVESL